MIFFQIGTLVYEEFRTSETVDEILNISYRNIRL